eukprot:scaffold2517_cov97-Amphora_coffeaeformis.AAC.4
MDEPRGGNSDPHDQNGIPIHDHIHNRSTKGIPQLHRALVESAAQAGTLPQGSVTYVCNHYDLYSKPFTEDGEKYDDEMTSKTFRGVSLHNNERGNSHGLEGKKGACKSNSAKEREAGQWWEGKKVLARVIQPKNEKQDKCIAVQQLVQDVMQTMDGTAKGEVDDFFVKKVVGETFFHDNTGQKRYDKCQMLAFHLKEIAC